MWHGYPIGQVVLFFLDSTKASHLGGGLLLQEEKGMVLLFSFWRKGNLAPEAKSGKMGFSTTCMLSTSEALPQCGTLKFWRCAMCIGLTIITPRFSLLTFPPLVLGGGSGSWIQRCTRPGSRLHQNRPGNCHQQHHCFANPYPSQLKNDWTSRCGCHYCFVHIVLAWGRQIGITPSWKSKVSWSLRSAKSEKVKLS